METISQLEASDEALVRLQLGQLLLLELLVPVVELDPLLADFIGCLLGNGVEGVHLQPRTEAKHRLDLHEALMSDITVVGQWRQNDLSQWLGVFIRSPCLRTDEWLAVTPLAVDDVGR